MTGMLALARLAAAQVAPLVGMDPRPIRSTASSDPKEAFALAIDTAMRLEFEREQRRCARQELRAQQQWQRLQHIRQYGGKGEAARRRARAAEYGMTVGRLYAGVGA